eukprot:scaffold1264_cov73-Cylindrotheca_fusiformis.AAC.2
MRLTRTTIMTRCAFEKFEAEEVNLRKYISKSVRPVYVIAPVALGGSSDVCLAASKDGKGCYCVVKFLIGNDDVTAHNLARKELANWKVAQQPGLPECKTAPVPNGICLILPYLRPIPPTERETLLNNNTMKKALERFAKDTKHIHSDVKWHHFGYYGEGEQERLYMCDLGRIQKCEDEAEQKDWVGKSVNIQRDRITFEPPPRVIASSSEQLEQTNGNGTTPTTTPKGTAATQQLRDSTEDVGDDPPSKRQKL